MQRGFTSITMVQQPLNNLLDGDELPLVLDKTPSCCSRNFLYVS